MWYRLFDTPTFSKSLHDACPERNTLHHRKCNNQLTKQHLQDRESTWTRFDEYTLSQWRCQCYSGELYISIEIFELSFVSTFYKDAVGTWIVSLCNTSMDNGSSHGQGIKIKRYNKLLTKVCWRCGLDSEQDQEHEQDVYFWPHIKLQCTI